MPNPNDIPPCPGTPQQRSAGTDTRTYHIRLITPLFGGGVEPGEYDLAFPIRETSIRGQLRFWWRATMGRHIQGAQELWRREEEVFGSSEFPSPLGISVSNFSGIKPIDPKLCFDQFGPESYALFAAVENKKRLLAEGLRFELTLSLPTSPNLRNMRAAQNRRRQEQHQSQLPSTIKDTTPENQSGNVSTW